MRSTDIVGYAYRADTYCRDCITDALPTGPGQAFDGWAMAPGARMSTESNLDEIAAAFSIDRYDEYSFDSNEFPKVIFADHDGIDACASCGELI